MPSRPTSRPLLAIATASTIVFAALPLGSLAASARPGTLTPTAAAATPATDHGEASASLVVSPTITGIVSATPSGGSGNGFDNGSALSAEGRIVAWVDESTNLVAGDTNGIDDVFVRDVVTGITERVDVNGTTQANGAADANPSISRDGRYVAYASEANNLVAGDTNARVDVFVRDRTLGTTRRVSVSSGSAQADGNSWSPRLSGNGRYVAFGSDATNLVTGDTNAKQDVFVRDLLLNTTTRVSVSSASVQGTGDSLIPSITNDGRYITFSSLAPNLVAGDTNAKQDVFQRDTLTSTTLRVSVATGGTQGTLDSTNDPAPVSDNGRYVTFSSNAPNLVSGDTNATADVFRRDVLNQQTVRVSLTDGDTQANGYTSQPTMSADGDIVGFGSAASNLVDGDTNGHGDSFKRTISTNTTVRQSVTTYGEELADGASNEALSADGSTSSFGSESGDVVAYPQGGGTVFIRHKVSMAPFISATGLIAQQQKDFGFHLGDLESATLLAKLLSGYPSPQRYVADLSRSTAWAGKRAPVTRLYWAFFLRAPDTGGLTYWINKVTSGASLSSVATQFAKSSEFTTKYGALNNTKFVTLVYQNVLSRNPDAAGLAHWVAKLDGGMTRGDMMTAFSESSEGKRKLAPQTEVVVLSLALLRVVPNASQFAAWRGTITGGGSLEDVVALIMATPAYGARITP